MLSRLARRQRYSEAGAGGVGVIESWVGPWVAVLEPLHSVTASLAKLPEERISLEITARQAGKMHTLLYVELKPAKFKLKLSRDRTTGPRTRRRFVEIDDKELLRVQTCFFFLSWPFLASKSTAPSSTGLLPQQSDRGAMWSYGKRAMLMLYTRTINIVYRQATVMQMDRR